MASIANTNVVMQAWRNAVAGKTSDYNIGTNTYYTNLATTLFVIMSDDADITMTNSDAFVFQSSITAGENPSFANRLVLGSVTLGSITGSIDAADSVFTGSSVLTGTDPLESLWLFKFITNAGASPLIAHWGATATTGLPITPNGADATVVWAAGGLITI